jgi:hypothetical protein
MAPMPGEISARGAMWIFWCCWTGRSTPAREILHIEPTALPLSLDHGIVLSVMPVSHEAYHKGETSFLRIVRKDAMQEGSQGARWTLSASLK